MEQSTNSIVSMLREIKPENIYSYNDKGNGELFADIFKNKCRYNVTAKEWYYYDGKVWSEDTGAMVASRCAKELADALLIYSVTISEETKKAAYLKHVVNLGQLRYRNTMLQDARDKYFISREMLNKDVDLFNCQNGVMNLRSFEFRKHNPDDLLSKISNVWYEPEAKSERFERFINEVMIGNVEKQEYLQKLFGYSMSGTGKEEGCYILYGSSTRNGKTSLVETISYMMGGADGYAMSMKPESLAQKQNNDSRQASGDIARLDGCRFLNVSEPPKRLLLDAGLLKSLTGRDTITARHLHEREFQFAPIFVLFWNVNYLPVINDPTLFTSGRINVITFDRHFSPDEQDKSLKEQLRSKENISGIFNWCLDGLKKYYIEGIIPPTAVKEATSEYQSQSDKIGNFMSEVLILSNKNSRAGDIYKAYQSWCQTNGYGQESKGNFFAELKTKGIYKPSGTINGKTERNVVVGYEVIEMDWEEVKANENIPFKIEN